MIDGYPPAVVLPELRKFEARVRQTLAWMEDLETLKKEGPEHVDRD
jgi:hypothetical protein